MLTAVLRRTVYRASVNVHHNRWSTTEASTQLQDVSATLLANAKPFNQIPGHKILPVIGSAWVYFPYVGKYDLGKYHISDMEQQKRFGDVVREKIGPFDIVNYYRPELFEKVVRSEGKSPLKREIVTLKAYRSLRKKWYSTPGIFILQGKEWHDLRFKVQPPIMKPKIIQDYLRPMHDISKQLVDKIRYMRDQKKEVDDFLPELYKWALESIAFVGLDTRLGCLDQNNDHDSENMKFIKAVTETLFCMNLIEAFTGHLPWWKIFPTPTWRKFVKASDIFTKSASNYINRSLEAIKTDTNEEKKLTLLQNLLLTPGLDLSGVMTTVMDMLFVGIETAGHAQGFLLYHLAQNPEKQEKLYEEIKRALPSPSSELNVAAVNELRYLKACLKESLRLNAITRGIARKFDHDIVLDGYRIPAGVNILFMSQTLMRSEKYFKKVNQFIPERWLDKENKPEPYLFVPFGVGPRSCIGRRLAEQEIIALTTEIIRNFKIEYHYEDIGINTRLINFPDKPLKIKFIER